MANSGRKSDRIFNINETLFPHTKGRENIFKITLEPHLRVTWIKVRFLEY